jgi:hypothetical protein
MYLCIPASKTMLHQKRMSIVDQSHLQQQTVETNCKNEPCWLDHVAERRGLPLLYSIYASVIMLPVLY